MSKSKSSASSECVKVAVRCRPLNELEKSRGEQSIVEIDRKLGSVSLLKAPGAPVDNTPGGDNKTFTFDHVFPPGTAQKLIYDETARPIVESVLAGYNGVNTNEHRNYDDSAISNFSVIVYCLFRPSSLMDKQALGKNTRRTERDASKLED
jgi:hypothetical protein